MAFLEGNVNKGCGCPEGYELLNGICTKVENVPAEYTGDLVTVEKGDIQPNVYGSQGLRLYQDLSNYTLPLAGRVPWNLYDNGGYATPQQPAGVNIVNTYLEDGIKSDLWGYFASVYPTCPSPSGRLNNAGIRAQLTNGKAEAVGAWDASNPTNLWIDLPLDQQLDVIRAAAITFEFCLDLPKERQFTIGIAADNEVIVSLDNVVQIYLGHRNASGQFNFPNDTFVRWHVFPITIPAGQHTIKLEGINDRFTPTTTAFAFSAEIYDLSAAEIQANFIDEAVPGVSCGTPASAITDHIIFSTENYINQDIPDPSSPGEWTCPDQEGTIDFCDGIPICTKILTAPQLSCCYEIEACSNPGVPIEISLADGQPTPIIGNVYLFDGDPSLSETCYVVTKEIQCTGSELIDITIAEDYETTDCNICVPCFKLTNCADNTETLIIKWSDPDDPLESINTIYVFDFDTTKCWTAEPVIPPCNSSIEYGPSNIVQQFEDCDDCLKPCYKIKDCIDQTLVYSDSVSLSNYVGQIISWNDGVEDKCGFVEKYICRENPQSVISITVLDCFFRCEDCLPKPEPAVPAFDLKPRIVKPGYDTPTCTPDYFDKVKCNWSEAVYQHMASIRFGIEFCCDPDLQKWGIKNEILDIESTKYPDIDCTNPCSEPEPPTCKEYTVADSVKKSFTQYLACGDTELTTALNLEQGTTFCADTSIEPSSDTLNFTIGGDCQN